MPRDSVPDQSAIGQARRSFDRAQAEPYPDSEGGHTRWRRHIMDTLAALVAHAEGATSDEFGDSNG